MTKNREAAYVALAVAFLSLPLSTSSSLYGERELGVS
jgi:hypothetical protein